VVPAGCLAAMVAWSCPAPSALDLAFLPGSGPGTGTARTAFTMQRGGGRAGGGRKTAWHRVVAMPDGSLRAACVSR
jgi:hypothetical protein